MRAFIKLNIILACIACISCRKKVDAIFTHAQFPFSDTSAKQVNSFAIKDGVFIALGSEEDINRDYTATQTIDLQNEFVYPGFNDAHCHFVGYAGDMYKCQLYNTSSFDEVLQKLTQYNDSTQATSLYGRGWNQNDWNTKEFPNNEKLNQLFPNKIVFLKRIDGHAALINETLYLKAKQVLQPYLQSSYVEKKNGKFTGMIFDNAMEAVESILPKIPKKSLINNLLIAQNDCFKLGITSVSDAGLSYDEIALVDSLQKAGKLHIKINAMMMAKKENLQKFEQKPISNTPLLRIQSLKVYCDGALGSRGACLKKPYSDAPSKYGELNITATELDEICKWAIDHQFQVCAHAIGDSTVSFVLSSYKKFLQPSNNLRWRVEHVQVCSPQDIDTFVRYNIIASVQPTHATSDMSWAIDRLGKDRIGNAYCYGTLLKNHVYMALGTDFPVEYLQPTYTFYAAVSRQDANGLPKDGFQTKDALTRHEAMIGMTKDPAFAEFHEKRKGEIKVGYEADFVVSKTNFLTDPLLSIRNSTTHFTYVNGQLQATNK